MEYTRKLILILALLIATSVVASAGASPKNIVKERCHPDDKKVLLGIKVWFGNNAFPSWLPEYDCCKSGWYGVKCDPFTHRVNRLFIQYNDDITGTIPPSVAHLPFLTTLEFHKNPNLTGTIPDSVATLRHLTFISCDFNSLSGPIPSFFGRMRNLDYLNLAFNRFSGSIPPELARAPVLSYLDLSRNLLTGTIPASFGNINRSGFALLLSHNQLSGPIPASLAKMNVYRIDFSRNNLTGDASLLFGPNNTLGNLDLSRNQLSFDFSTVRISSSMLYLDLDHNRLFGGFPMTGLENLQLLNVSYNRLCGSIPNVGNLPTFDQTAYFHNRCLCGPPLPACNSTTA